MSSSKSQFGHCIGAAGAIEFAVCISSLEDGYVPPNVSLTNPIGGLGIRLAPNQSIEADVRHVMSNSFGVDEVLQNPFPLLVPSIGWHRDVVASG